MRKLQLFRRVLVEIPAYLLLTRRDPVNTKIGSQATPTLVLPLMVLAAPTYFCPHGTGCPPCSSPYGASSRTAHPPMVPAVLLLARPREPAPDGSTAQPSQLGGAPTPHRFSAARHLLVPPIASTNTKASLVTMAKFGFVTIELCRPVAVTGRVDFLGTHCAIFLDL
jgi:hypothetical protein